MYESSMTVQRFASTSPGPVPTKKNKAVKQAFLWDQENIPLARPTQSHPADIAWMP